MMRRRYIFIVVILLLTFFTTFLFFKMQEKDLITKLDNHNLSENAYVLKTKEQNLDNYNATLVNSKKITDFQIHYQVKNKKNVSYFYAKGSYEQPPMISGTFFSSNDFLSEVPVAVVGRNVSKTLYSPFHQQYYKLNGQYVAVIGIMGDKYNSELDNQIFIAMSDANPSKLKAENANIILDSKDLMTKPTLTSKLANTTVSKQVKADLILTNHSWIRRHWQQTIGLLAVIAGVALATYIWVVGVSKQIRNQKFIKQSNKLIIWNNLLIYTGSFLVGGLLGTAIGQSQFSIKTNTMILYEFEGSLFIIASVIFYFVINRKVTKQNK
ncbi:ABC transporter permease [Dellaglioa algida]|uniref:ABC transporter permease n=1 Tax=Dellaglioa algida TaxID=105612 RepID=UPI0024C4BB43|nr:ABC transporter permease [Dellaglioa algida]MDK1726415.1 ABC transporter permease [Dellaglioa algida]